MPRTASPAAGCWPACSASMAAAPAAWAVASDILWCLGLGCLLGAARDLLDLVPGGGAVRCFLGDIAVFAAAAVLVCGFAAGVSSSGVARWYMAAGTLGGALAWYGALRGGLHRAARLAGKALRWPFWAAWRALCRLCKRCAVALRCPRHKKVAKTAKNQKKQLQTLPKIVYNEPYVAVCAEKAQERGHPVP